MTDFLSDPLYEEPEHELETIDSEEICELRFRRSDCIVDGLLEPGLAVLAGSPKTGKSWLVLQLCLSIAKGEPFWGMSVRQSDVLYIALEDSRQRLQQRILTVTDTPSPHLHLAIRCSPFGEELERELGKFVTTHPATRVIVIDTFQRIRPAVQQMSYANDYAEVSRLKSIADAMNICILLVHHTRKLGDSDRFNEISGTNGIAGSADTLMVLTKEKRTDRKAVLSCTGRDIEDMELELSMNRKNCVWKCMNPASSGGGRTLPDEMIGLWEYMRGIKRFEGSNAEFIKGLSGYCGKPLRMSVIGRYLSLNRYAMEDMGVSYMQTRTQNERRLLICYDPGRDKSGGRGADPADSRKPQGNDS